MFYFNHLFIKIQALQINQYGFYHLLKNHTHQIHFIIKLSIFISNLINDHIFKAIFLNYNIFRLAFFYSIFLQIFQNIFMLSKLFNLQNFCFFSLKAILKKFYSFWKNRPFYPVFTFFLFWCLFFFFLKEKNIYIF